MKYRQAVIRMKALRHYQFKTYFYNDIWKNWRGMFTSISLQNENVHLDNKIWIVGLHWGRKI